VRKTGIPEWGFRSGDRAKDLKARPLRGRGVAAFASSLYPSANSLERSRRAEATASAIAAADGPATAARNVAASIA
jgi:hypothetical protein